MRRLASGGAVAGLLVASLWTVPPGAATVGPTCGGRAATIVGTTATDITRGTPGADVIVGGPGPDFIHGGPGDDWICGGGNSDQLSGDAGDDHLFGGRDGLYVGADQTVRTGDLLVGGAGDDRLAGGRDTRKADVVVPDTLSWPGERRVRIDTASGSAVGQGHDRFVSRGALILGSDAGDVIDGGPHRDLLSGWRGADVIRGHGGDDEIVTDRMPNAGRTSADVARGGSGNDRIAGGGGGDLLVGGPGHDVVEDPTYGLPPHMYGGPGGDRMSAELVHASGRRLVVDGGQGHDAVELRTWFYVSPTPSTVTWDMVTGTLVLTVTEPVTARVVGFESARLMAIQTAWTIWGTSGPDAVKAQQSDGTRFVARRGDDTFKGSWRDDTFDGGRGIDRALTMGRGTDTCSSVEQVDRADCDIVIP